MFFNKDLYVAVQLQNEAQASEALSHYDRDHREDDLCSPFSDEKNVRIFYYSYIEASEIEDITNLLVDAKIPYKAFHTSGFSGTYGWIFSKLNDLGEMESSTVVEDGEMIYIQDVQDILNQANTLDEVKRNINLLIKKQEIPDWN